MRAARGALGRVLATALATIIVFTLLEASLRVFGPFLPGNYRTGTFIERDDDLGWRHIPNAVMWYHERNFTNRVEINAQGRRGPLIAQERSNHQRVVILGDSLVEGKELPEASILPTLLAAQVGGATEVVNEGVSGYGTDQELLTLRTRALPLRPEVAVLAFTVTNDVWENDVALEPHDTPDAKPYFDLAGGDELVLHRPISSVGLPERLRRLLSGSTVLSMLKSGIVEPLSDRTQDLRVAELGVLREPTGEWSRAWRITELLIRQIAIECRSAGVRLVLVIIPDVCQVHADTCGSAPDLSTSTVPQQRIAAAASAVDIRAIDLLPTFRERAAQGVRLYYPNDFHWNASGHALAAQVIAPTVRELLGISR